MPIKTFPLLLVLLLSFSAIAPAQDDPKSGVTKLTDAEKAKFQAVYDELLKQKPPHFIHLVLTRTSSNADFASAPLKSEREKWMDTESYMFRVEPKDKTAELNESLAFPLNNIAVSDGSFLWNWGDSKDEKVRRVTKLKSDIPRLANAVSPSQYLFFIIQDRMKHGTNMYAIESVNDVRWNGKKATRITQKFPNSVTEWILDPDQNNKPIFVSTKSKDFLYSWKLLKTGKTKTGFEYDQDYQEKFFNSDSDKGTTIDYRVTLYEPIDKLPDNFPNIPTDVARCGLGITSYPLSGKPEDGKTTYTPFPGNK